MAKRKTPKVKDLKVKADKITAEELTELQRVVSGLELRYLEVGKIENQKHQVLHQIAGLQDNIKLLQTKLEDKYGKNVDIDVRDGSIKEKDGKVNS
tara:strand:+ start:1186 stop:1473 length:288 start_codon:yes stop_codon:yes gene_type:complete